MDGPPKQQDTTMGDAVVDPAEVLDGNDEADKGDDDDDEGSSFPQNADEDNDDDDEAAYPDDECAEGEDPFPARLEPSEAAANRQLFRNICFGLEAIWLEQGVGGVGIGGPTRTTAANNGGGRNRNNNNKKKPPVRRTEAEKLNLLLPINMLKAFDRVSREPGARPESLFPIYRLLLPHMDTRRIHMGESKLADIYATAFHWPNHTKKYQMLHAYADPQFVTKTQGQGDLSCVIKWVVQDHQAIADQDLFRVGSDWTVGQMNEKLDEFAKLPVVLKQQKDALERRNQASPTKKAKTTITLKTVQADWLRSLHNNNGSDGRKGLSPIEHKWLARILMKKMQFGLVWLSHALLFWSLCRSNISLRIWLLPLLLLSEQHRDGKNWYVSQVRCCRR
jgi:hypothetical protein